jgi:5'-nucleotidase
MDRRSFLQRTATGSLLLVSSQFPLNALSEPEMLKLSILHTNDVHSRIDPFPMDGSRNQGLGGISRRAAIIQNIRQQEDHVLLFDAGDIFQGTPYFNVFGGELEMKLMSKMGYDAATIGNHDFDAGADGLAKQLVHANFPMVISNYRVNNSPLQDKVLDHKIIQKGDIKIGVFGIGIELKGLVPQDLYGEIQYEDPIRKAQEYAHKLKRDADCDFVICLSHLGYRYQENRVSDWVLAHATEDIDLIVGGHTHTFMREPDILNNKKGKPVAVNQVGWAGIMLGRLDVHFEKNSKKTCVSCSNRYIS